MREELPVRIAHRLRDMQTLPYSVLTNTHMSHVYALYLSAFSKFIKVAQVRSVDDNDKFCTVIREALKEHLTVIPRLVMGVVECQGRVPEGKMDVFVNKLLRSRISRRVIAEQHLALSDSFRASRRGVSAEDDGTPAEKPREDRDADFVGRVFLRVHAASLVQSCAETITKLCRQSYGPEARLPEVRISGHTDATLTYIPSHLEYVLGELLRNSVQAIVEKHLDQEDDPPPIEVLVCEGPQHIIFRVSDQGGGISRDILPHLWSFVSGPRKQARLENLNNTRHLSATLQELEGVTLTSLDSEAEGSKGRDSSHDEVNSSLSTLQSRSPSSKLGIGLPMSRVYAEYWAGSLDVRSMEGYGVDAFLSVSRLGNRNEQLLGREGVDSL